VSADAERPVNPDREAVLRRLAERGIADPEGTLDAVLEALDARGLSVACTGAFDDPWETVDLRPWPSESAALRTLG
jgi:hypothetical protein